MFFFKKKRPTEKVVGEIIRFEVVNNKHYPVFKFTTLNGNLLELRNIPKETGIEEASLEDIYNELGVQEKLNEPLPIKDIPIKYIIEDPTEFYPRWI